LEVGAGAKFKSELLKQSTEDLGDTGRDSHFGAGLINAGRAVAG